MGNTIGQLQTVLDNAASYLSTIGSASPDFSQLISFVLQQAGDFGRSTSATPSGRWVWGCPIRISSPSTDSSGNVAITQGGLGEPFTKLPNGTYEAAPEINRR